LFEPTLDVIKQLEGDRYPTQSYILILLHAIETKVNCIIEEYNSKDRSGKQFRLVVLDLKEELSIIWDKLPVDTIIASILDPRFKDLLHIPEEERVEGWKHLADEYKKIELPLEIKKEQEEKKKKTVLKLLLEGLEKKYKEQLPDELNRWENSSRIDWSEDPLLWWKLNGYLYPKLAIMAKKYLSVPSSQATVERSFKVPTRIISYKRSNLSPTLTSKLVICHQNRYLFSKEICNYDN